MGKNAVNKVEEVLRDFLTKNSYKTTINENELAFSNEKNSYKIVVDGEKKCIELFLCGEDKDKSVSKWLFDAEKDSDSDLKDIALDFLEILKGPDKSTRQAEKKKSADDDKTVNSLFFMNRLATIFPELKEEIQGEKESYESFRGVTFAREKALPKVLKVLNDGQPKDKFKKICVLFNNMYDNGDLDVRGIVTIVFLNALEDEQTRQKVSNLLSNELKKSFAAAEKLKGKKIKPEVPKKKKEGLMARALKEANK